MEVGLLGLGLGDAGVSGRVGVVMRRSSSSDDVSISNALDYTKCSDISQLTVCRLFCSCYSSDDKEK